MQVTPPVVDPILEPRRDAPVAEADVPVAASARLAACARLAEGDAEAAIAEGARWLIDGGGADAEQCLGLGYVAAERWQEAAEAFGRGADAVPVGDPRHAALLAQAANALLAGGDTATAKTRLDALLAIESLDGATRGEALIDRARAHVALGDGAAAQADLTAAQALVPDDKLVWLFSATLARRQGQLDAAGDFIDRALELDRNDPAILLEAGNIAIRMNAYEIARQAWTEAAAADPGGTAGQAAQANLDRLAAMAAEEGNIPVELPETAAPEDEAEEADPAP